MVLSLLDPNNAARMMKGMSSSHPLSAAQDRADAERTDVRLATQYQGSRKGKRIQVRITRAHIKNTIGHSRR
jgi:hypothetical protein